MQAGRKAGVLFRVKMPTQDGVDERAYHAHEGKGPIGGADTLVLSSRERDVHRTARPNHVYPVALLARPVDTA
jgi:hypothetical protein